jgi:hypothetical protein
VSVFDSTNSMRSSSSSRISICQYTKNDNRASQVDQRVLLARRPCACSHKRLYLRVAHGHGYGSERAVTSTGERRVSSRAAVQQSAAIGLRPQNCRYNEVLEISFPCARRLGRS